MKVWQKRIIRLWVLVILPLALYCGYITYDSHLNISFWQERSTKILEQAKSLSISKNQPLFSVQEMREIFDKAIIERDINIKRRLTFSILTSILLCFPLVVWLIFHACKWIWYGKKNRK